MQTNDEAVQWDIRDVFRRQFRVYLDQLCERRPTNGTIAYCTAIGKKLQSRDINHTVAQNNVREL